MQIKTVWGGGLVFLQTPAPCDHIIRRGYQIPEYPHNCEANKR